MAIGHWTRRASALTWSLLACPLIGLLIGWVAGGDLAGVGTVAIFIGIPVCLSLGGLSLLRRGALETVVLSVLSGAEGGFALFVLVLWLASQGIFDT